MRILFISANRLGDAVITCGILDHLIRTHPDARFTIACGPAAAGVYARMPQLERIVVFDKHKNDSHWPKLWRQVAFAWWDLVIDIRGSALGYLIPARRRVVRRKRPGRMFEQHAAMLGDRAGAAAGGLDPMRRIGTGRGCCCPRIGRRSGSG